MIRRSAVLALLFAGAFSAVARGETELTVQLTQISEQKAVFASVESVDVTRARARIAGLVRDLVVDEGSLVKRGQRLALVVDAKLKLGLAALDARLASLAGPVEAWPRRRSSGLGGCTVPATSARPASTRRWPTSMPSRPTQRPSRRSAPCWCSAAPRGAVLAPAAGRVLRVALTNGSVVMPGRDQHPAAQIGAHAGAPAAEHAAAHH